MITDGTAFGKAVCEHFKLPANQVIGDMPVHTLRNEVFGVTLTIALTPQDLAEIAKHMGKERR